MPIETSFDSWFFRPESSSALYSTTQSSTALTQPEGLLSVCSLAGSHAESSHRSTVSVAIPRASGEKWKRTSKMSVWLTARNPAVNQTRDKAHPLRATNSSALRHTGIGAPAINVWPTK